MNAHLRLGYYCTNFFDMHSNKSITEDKTHYNERAIPNLAKHCITVQGTHHTNEVPTVRIAVSGYYDTMRLVENLGKAAKLLLENTEQVEHSVVADLLYIQQQIMPVAEAAFLDELLFAPSLPNQVSKFKAIENSIDLTKSA